MATRSAGWLIALIAASAALTVSACGGEDGDTTGSEPRRLSDAELRAKIEGTGNGRQEDDVVVRLRPVERPGGPRFVDDHPTVKMGQVKLELINRRSSPARHSISLEGYGIFKNDYGGTPGRSSFVRSDLGPGKYAFFCSTHREQGMKGTLTVIRDPAIEAKLARQ